jgi:hypothetical protein
VDFENHHLPDEVALKAFAGQAPFGGAWFMFHLPTTKNPVTLVVGPANEDGEVVVAGEDLLADYGRAVSLAIQDYGHWSGEVFVEVVSMDALVKLRAGYELWGNTANYPIGYAAGLDHLEAALNGVRAHDLRVVVGTQGPGRVEAMLRADEGRDRP